MQVNEATNDTEMENSPPSAEALQPTENDNNRDFEQVMLDNILDDVYMNDDVAVTTKR